jgi:hypothetical protein
MLTVETDMAKPIITKVRITNASGMVIEAELTIEQLRQLAGTNGHVSPNGNLGSQTSDYAGLKAALSVNARKLLSILKKSPNGIAADTLATEMGFRSGTQIGGVTGGGLVKLCIRYGVETKDIYTMEVTTVSGKRLAVYRPGKELARVL